MKKACSHREGTKTAKIFKGKFKNLKNISEIFFSSRSIIFLRALRFFAVKRVFLQWTHYCLWVNIPHFFIREENAEKGGFIGLGFCGLIKFGKEVHVVIVSGKCDFCQDCMSMLSTYIL